MEITIHPEGHIDTHYLEKHYLQETNNLEKDKTILTENKATINQFIYDAKIGKTIRKGQKKKIGKRRIIRFIYELKRLDNYFKKPYKKVSQIDMEKFIMNLEEGRILKKNGQPYSIESQVTTKKIIKKFYKWLLGNNRHFPELVEWIDTTIEVPEYKAISKEQVERIVDRLTSIKPEIMIRNRAIIMFLFDSGVRADEALNIRLKHLVKEGDKFKVRIEFSKTKKRTLMLPISSEWLHKWLIVHPANNNPLAQLFPLKYDALRIQMSRAGKTINQRITAHSMRHSSATYWARHLNRYQLCYRFGWAMSSKQPDRYIDREGLDQEQVTVAVETETNNGLKKENEELKQRMAMLEEQMEQLLSGDREKLLKIIKSVLKEDA